jgi:SAM-dependent methyltransferase
VAEPDHLRDTIAAYDATADLYAEFIGTEITAAIEGPVDRALLDAFVELVAPSGRLIADVGCGTGRVTAFLAARGLAVVGVEPSPGMLSIAATAHPGLRFEPGAIGDIPVADESLAGAVCWYSIIHTPPGHLPTAFDELARVIELGGQLLIAFQAGGGESVHRESLQGRSVSLTNYRHDPVAVSEQLTAAGFHVHSTTVRDADAAHESTPQAFLMARR